MMANVRRFSRVFTLLALTVVALTFVFGCYRTNWPANQRRELDCFRKKPVGTSWCEEQVANVYDDSVTRVTARNFAHDGFWHTRLLPNRGGFPYLSLWDQTQTQCEAPTEPKNVLRYRDGGGNWIKMTSLNNDCVYAHYPPLADWIFGIMASVGLASLHAYRLLAVALNATLLWFIYAWLRREVSEPAALVSTVLTATLPAFNRWLDATYYHCFHFLFLIAGLLAWSLYLEQRRVRWFVATWLLFLLESLVSYQLIMFFGVVLAAQLALEPWRAWRRHVRLLAVQSLAPTLAFALHFGMRLLLLGGAGTWHNALTTFQTRATDGVGELGFLRWMLRVREHILRYDVVALSVLLIVAVRLAARAPLKRPLVLLGALLLGGLTFGAVFLGTTLGHYWMMYRQLMPFAVFLLALTAENVVLLLRTVRAGLPVRPAWLRHPAAIATLIVLSAVPPGWTAYRNSKEVRTDLVRRTERRSFGPHDNIAPQFLDAVYWTEGNVSGSDDRVEWIVDGRRVYSPPNPNMVFNVLPGGTSYDEVWWLDAVSVATVGLLTEEAYVASASNACRLAWFDGAGFVPLPTGSRSQVRPFVPEPGEPAAPAYRWIEFSLTHPVKTRAVRLICSYPAKAFPLHELAVLQRTVLDGSHR